MRLHRTVEVVSAVFVLGVCLAGMPKGEAAKYPSVNYTDASPHKSGFADLNGIKPDYLDWGGDGPPRVMMHGIGDDPHILDDVAWLPRDRFRIVAYARLGRGLSDSPPASVFNGRAVSACSAQCLISRGRFSCPLFLVTSEQYPCSDYKMEQTACGWQLKRVFMCR